MWQKIDQLVHKAQNRKLNGRLENLRKKYNYHKQDNYYRFLYYCVQEFQPAISVEIGIDFAVGSRHMVEAAKTYDGLVIGIDILEKAGEVQALKKDTQHYRFINDSSTDQKTIGQLNKLVKTHGPIGLVYQDSSHHYLESEKEWDLISPFCTPGAIWICDDITHSFHDPNIDPPGKGMLQYFMEIPREHKRLYQDVLHYGNCQGIVIV